VIGDHGGSGAGLATDETLRGLRLVLLVCGAWPNLRRTTGIAIVVGAVLTAINQGDVIAAGDATAVTGVKIALNFVVPFIVSNVGLVTGARTVQGP
jgi:hypothetical protein